MPGIDLGQSCRHPFVVRSDDGGNDFVLGLEVVVHISDWHVRHLRDVGQRRAFDALLVQELHRRSHQSLSFSWPFPFSGPLLFSGPASDRGGLARY